MALPVALQLYTVREELARDFEGTVRKVAEMGYAGVEPAGFAEGISPAEMKRIFDENNLFCVSAHIPLAQLAADLEGTIAKCKELGLKYVVIPYLGDGERPGQEGFADTLEKMKKIGEACKANGMVQLYHNHDFEFVKVGEVYGLDYMYETIPADLLQTELDTCWVNVGGEVPADYIRKYAGRTPVVHLKDFFGEKSDDMYELIGIEKKAPTRPNNFEFRPVGSGLQDFPPIIEAAKFAGAGWVVVEQDKPSMGLTSLECIEKSRKYLESIGY